MRGTGIAVKIAGAALAAILAAGGGALSQTDGASLGIILGEPTGIAGKMWTGESTAVAGAMAWSFEGEEHVHVHADWLWHNWNVLQDNTDIQEGYLPLYYGIGARLKAGDESALGARFVLGVSYMFEAAPFDVFFEIVPIMDVVPETELNGNAGLGARFWF